MVAKHKYDVTGIAKKLNDTTVEITELPIYKWTQNFKADLEGMIGEKGDGVVKVRDGFQGLVYLADRLSGLQRVSR